MLIFYEITYFQKINGIDAVNLPETVSIHSIKFKLFFVVFSLNYILEQVFSSGFKIYFRSFLNVDFNLV